MSALVGLAVGRGGGLLLATKLALGTTITNDMALGLPVVQASAPRRADGPAGCATNYVCLIESEN